MEFNNYLWHDSVIENIFIDRKNPGHQDEISIELNMVDIGKVILKFEKVYWIKFDLNFGFIVSENIDEAYITDQSDTDLVRIKESWSKMLQVELDLRCFIIKTNSTGGTIKIISTDFTIQAMSTKMKES